MGRGRFEHRLTEQGVSRAAWLFADWRPWLFAARGQLRLDQQRSDQQAARGEGAAGRASAGREAESHFDETVIALAFSGGGMRAAAFSHGVLTGLADTTIRTRGGPVSLIDRVDIISGVSGGSVPAAYFGLKKRAALADFRESSCCATPRNRSRPTSTSPTCRAASPAASTTRPIPALARRQPVQRRDLRRHEHDAAAARLDQRLRYLQPHAVPVRPRRVRRVVQRLLAISGVAGGRGFGSGAGVLRAGCDRELLRQVPAAAAGMGRARRATIRTRRRCCGSTPTRSCATARAT